MDLKTWAMRLATIVVAVGIYAMAALVLKDTGAYEPVIALAGLVGGLVLPQIARGGAAALALLLLLPGLSGCGGAAKPADYARPENVVAVLKLAESAERNLLALTTCRDADICDAAAEADERWKVAWAAYDLYEAAIAAGSEAIPAYCAMVAAAPGAPLPREPCQ